MARLNEEMRRAALDVCTPEQIRTLESDDDNALNEAILARVQFIHFWLFVIAGVLGLILWRVW